MSSNRATLRLIRALVALTASILFAAAGCNSLQQLGAKPAPSPGSPESYIGTWEHRGGEIVGRREFRADGTGIETNNEGSRRTLRWSAGEGRLEVRYDDLPDLAQPSINDHITWTPDGSRFTTSAEGGGLRISVDWNRVPGNSAPAR